MRVALLAFDHPEYCAALANGLAETTDVRLWLPEPEAREASAGLRPDVRLTPFANPRLRQPAAQVATCLGLVRGVRRWRPDVVHLQQGHLWLNHFLPLLRSCPLVVTVHDATAHPGDRPTRKTPQWVRDLAFRRADRVIVHADTLRPQAIARGVRADRIHVVPHVAVGGPQAHPAAEDDGRTVLFFGRIWPYKGLEHLIRAEPLLSELVPRVRIVIAGEGEEMTRYRRLMAHPERFAIHDRWISDDERSQLFARASVVVLPYVEASQSGVVPIAYAHGKAVVASRVGGLPEAVEDGRTGLLVPPGDPAALARALARVLTDPGLRRALGEAGRRKLARECAPEAVAQRTLAVYRVARSQAAGRAGVPVTT